MRPKRKNGFTLTELLVTISIIGVLAAILIPTLAGAKRKANRAKCINNLKQLSSAFIGYTTDYRGRLPWQLTQMQAKGILAKGADSAQPNVYCSIREIKSTIGKAEILISPCDPDRTVMLDTVRANWKHYNHNTPIPAEAISYVFIEGADAARPTTILAATRNLFTSDLAEGNNRWVGADEADPNTGKIPASAMALLLKNEGHYALMDGSSSQSTDSDLGPTGEIVKLHLSATGGLTKEPASTRILGSAPVSLTKSKSTEVAYEPNSVKLGKNQLQVNILDYGTEFRIAMLKNAVSSLGTAEALIGWHITVRGQTYKLSSVFKESGSWYYFKLNRESHIGTGTHVVTFASAQAVEEANRKAEEAARAKAEAEAKRKAEEEAKRKAAEEAKRKAAEEAKRKAEEAARQKAAEEAAIRKAEAEAAKLKAALEEAKHNAAKAAEEEARRKKAWEEAKSNSEKARENESKRREEAAAAAKAAKLAELKAAWEAAKSKHAKAIATTQSLEASVKRYESLLRAAQSKQSASKRTLDSHNSVVTRYNREASDLRKRLDTQLNWAKNQYYSRLRSIDSKWRSRINKLGWWQRHPWSSTETRYRKYWRNEQNSLRNTYNRRRSDISRKYNKLIDKAENNKKSAQRSSSIARSAYNKATEEVKRYQSILNSNRSQYITAKHNQTEAAKEEAKCKAAYEAALNKVKSKNLAAEEAGRKTAEAVKEEAKRKSALKSAQQKAAEEAAKKKAAEEAAKKKAAEVEAARKKAAEAEAKRKAAAEAARKKAAEEEAKRKAAAEAARKKAEAEREARRRPVRWAEVSAKHGMINRGNYLAAKATANISGKEIYLGKGSTETLFFYYPSSSNQTNVRFLISSSVLNLDKLLQSADKDNLHFNLFGDIGIKAKFVTTDGNWHTFASTDIFYINP